MRHIILLLIFLVSGTLSLFAQELFKNDKYYVTTSNDMIFSFANVKYIGADQGTIMRWAPLFNPRIIYNYDHHDVYGFFGGISLQNVGFIMDIPDEPDTRKKFRTYNLGIPIGAKFGVLHRAYFYGGLSFEFPINYKEKTFIDGDKEDKFVVWFGDRVPGFQSAFFAGFRMPLGLSIKFKYYMSQFFNRDFTTFENNVEVQPYKDFNAHVFYFSLNVNLFRNTTFIHQDSVDKVF